MLVKAKKEIVCLFVVLGLQVAFNSCSRKEQAVGFERFAAKYGQIEVGGRYVGAEFHHSRPLPSRISFFYPVANSLDLSTGYWERDLSQPLSIEISRDGRTERFGDKPAVYEYTPYEVVFIDTLNGCRLEMRYQFADDLPAAVLSLSLSPSSPASDTVQVTISLEPTLRTSHSYAWKKTDSLAVSPDGNLALAFYNDVETDSAVVFLADVSTDCRPQEPLIKPKISKNASSRVRLTRSVALSPQGPAECVWLLGSCRRNERQSVIETGRADWKNNIEKLQNRITEEACRRATFTIPVPAMRKTMIWSKAAVASLQHYIDGWFVPMPCPAEYNFFFTHDLLLTGLGVMFYNSDFVRNGYEFLLSKTEADSVLPHAYYWKDGRYVTETCAPDNWNHLWVIISAGAYLKHSGDTATVTRLYPVLKKSLKSALQNLGEDDLMYSSRPDWWDIGNRTGARTYLSVLLIRAVEEFVFLSAAIGRDCPEEALLTRAATVKAALTSQLWNEEMGFLLNGLDRSTLDFHYYAGSLTACMFDVIEDEKKQRMLQTARMQLLDEALGIRNAWPADFHRLIDIYHFNGLEVGEPFYYFNGGIWMHNNAWYALSLIEADQVNEAEKFINKVMTLEGIRNSPRGQPSFYEYRMTNPDDPEYGAVDKPNFLWAAGWTIQTLYRLAGLRANSRQIRFSAHLPDDFKKIEYDVLLGGNLCRVRYSGAGRFFKTIFIDGHQRHSAVVIGSPKRMMFERGRPKAPYVADAVGRLQAVSYNPKNKQLIVDLSFVPGQTVRLEVVSPWQLQQLLVNGLSSVEQCSDRVVDCIHVLTAEHVCRNKENQYCFQF